MKDIAAVSRASTRQQGCRVLLGHVSGGTVFRHRRHLVAGQFGDRFIPVRIAAPVLPISCRKADHPLTAQSRSVPHAVQGSSLCNGLAI